MIPFLRGVDVRRKVRKKKEKLFFPTKKKKEKRIYGWSLFLKISVLVFFSNVLVIRI